MVWLVLVLSIAAVALMYWLIRRSAATGFASLFYLVPVVTALFAYILFGERLDSISILGMLISASGVALVNRGIARPTDKPPAPDAWAFGAIAPLSNRVSCRLRSPLPGNGISRAEKKASIRPPNHRSAVSETKRSYKNPANSGPKCALFVRDQETPVRTGVRGGAGRTRTSSQTVMSGRL
jgi:EamA-like transporter family